MSKNEKSPRPGALEKMFDSVTADPLRPETPREVVDDELRAAGGDPARIRAEGGAFAQALLEKRRDTLKKRLRDELVRKRKAAARAPRISRDSRDELLAMLAKVQEDPRWAGEVSAMFRKRNAAEASNDEIATLLEEIEALRLLDEDDQSDD